MKKSVLLGAMIGFAVGAAAAVAGKITFDKVACEMKTDMGELRFASPNEDHLVTFSYGSSQTAKGLTLIRILATSKTTEEVCKLSLLAKAAPQSPDAEWIDNDHFKLRFGNGKRRQCCDISFDPDRMTAKYFPVKDR